MEREAGVALEGERLDRALHALELELAVGELRLDAADPRRAVAPQRGQRLVPAGVEQLAGARSELRGLRLDLAPVGHRVEPTSRTLVLLARRRQPTARATRPSSAWIGESSRLMGADRSDKPAGVPSTQAGAIAAVSVVVAVVLGDSGVVTLALPEILRDFGSEVGEVAWVLIAFNVVLALVAVPAARVCVRGDPAAAPAGGLVVFAAATAVCAAAPSLGVLVAARAIQAV